MVDPILLDVQIAGADQVVQQADAMGEALGRGFAAPSADVDRLNAAIAALAATITKLGATASATAQQVQGVTAASASFDALVASADEFQAHMNASSEAAEKLAEILTHLGEQSQHAGQQIHAMGEAGGAAAASFKLLQTSAAGAVEILTGGGLSASISLVRELGEGVESTAKHFGTIGEEIGKAVAHFSLFAVGVGGLAVGAKELADKSAEDTLQIHALAQALGVGEANILQLKSAFRDAGVSMEQFSLSIRSVAVRMQDAWAGIQRSVRDATLPIVQDQLAIQAAVRATEQAVIGVREAAMDTAQAQENASTAQADADRAAAEAQISASEAVIHQKEAELDAQNKLADAQRAYADATVNANEAQMNLADAQKDFQYQGDDAWRRMKDAIDAVADAERKAADEATAVQEAMLSVAEAATGVQSAYVSLYAAQLAYREAHGEGRITRQERAELRREQTEVGLKSAEERVQSAQFAYQRTARDAVPEAREQQARAERGVGAAKEAEDKASQQYTESQQRAADKLEKAGSAAAEALERVAKAALEVTLAPQKAQDETAKAQLDVEGALANVRKTEFAATQAQARAEDALEQARLKEKAALDAVTAAEIAATTARNKAVDDLNANINAVRQYLRTGRGPAGFDIRQTPPGEIARAAEFEVGGPGHMLEELKLLQKAFQDAIIPMSEFEGVMTAVGYSRAILSAGTPQGADFRRQFAPVGPGNPVLAPPLVQEPTAAQRARGEVIQGRVEGAEELERAERKAASALSNLADDIGAKFIPAVTTAAQKIAESPKEAAAAGLGLTAGTYVAGQAVTALAAALGPSIAKSLWGALTGGGAAKMAGAAVGEAETVIPGILSGGRFGATAKEVEGLAKAASTLETEALAAKTGVAAVATELGVAEGGLGTFALALTKLSVPLTLIGSIIEQVLTYKPGPAETDALNKYSLPGVLTRLFGGGQSAPAAAPTEQPFKRTGLTGNVGETPLPPAGGSYDLPPAFVPPSKQTAPTAQPVPLPTMIAVPAAASESSAKQDEVVEKLIDLTNAITQSREHEVASSAEVGGDKLTVAVDKLDEAAIKLDMAAEKMGGGAPGAPAPGERTEQGASDAVDKIKESIDKLVSGKGLIQPPTDQKERSAYDEEVRHLLQSITEVNQAQKGLIEEQTRATAEGEKLAKEQEDLTKANTEKVKQETSDEAKLADAQVNKLQQETSDEHEIALRQEALIEEQTQKIVNSQPVTGQAAGGPVVGPGGVDQVPIMATAGEYVVNVPATSKHRSLLEQINAGGELHFQLGGYVGGLNPGLAHEPSTGAIQSALTSNIGMGPGGYMMAKMQSQSTQSYAVDLRTDHGTYTVLATEDQMGAMLQGSIAQKIASTGPKPSWWS